MLDKLSLTIPIVPDVEYLMNHGEVREDQGRNHIYKNMCRLDKALVLYQPHKFSAGTNAKIPFTKVELNPKHFECYDYLAPYLFAIFGDSIVSPADFNTARVDIAVDLEDFPIDVLLSVLRIQRIRTESLSFFKGTIYAGSDPKIRIYDKSKQLRNKIKEGQEDGLTDYELKLIDSEHKYTRFEIQIRKTKKTLQDLINDPVSLASYFDRLEFFHFPDSTEAGVLQVVMKYVNRKFRAELEKYRDHELTRDIKERYALSVKEWFRPGEEPF